MKIIFLGKIKFYDEISARIKLAVNKILEDFDKELLDFDLLFEWNEVEGEIFWDVYDDVIRFGIPLSQKNDLDVLTDKIKRALIQKTN